MTIWLHHCPGNRYAGDNEGYSEDYVRVFVKENRALQGRVVKVKIKELMLDGVLAEPVEE